MGPFTCQGSSATGTGTAGTRPGVGRRPTTRKAAGTRRLPPRSVPSASQIIREAKPAAPPPVEPPGE